MLQPIQKDHEIMCPSCGCVLRDVSDSQEMQKPTPTHSIDVFFLGSALEKSVQYAFLKNPQQVYEERVLRQLIDITKEFALPERLANETFKELKRKRRGFRSESLPIKQLLRILSKDENYLHIHKMRAIKAKYESILAG
jgi:hypothetical protein